MTNDEIKLRENFKNLEEITNYNQILWSDTLLIDTVFGLFKAYPRRILFQGTPEEEIVIHVAKNHYFILSMVFSGNSWVKKVYRANLYDFKGIKSYRKGNVKNL